MIDNDIKVTQSYARNISTTRESDARKWDVTEQCPLDVAVIARHQKTERHQLREYVSDHRSPYTETKLNGEHVILYKDKLYIPKALQERVVNWYHWFLWHPGSTRLAKNIQQACN